MSGRPGRSRADGPAVALGLALLLGAGLLLFRDYGVPWDEHYQREYGHLVLRHVLRGDPALLADKDRYYGPAFEALLAAAESLPGVGRDSRRILFLRHGMVYACFAAGVAFFFLLCARIRGGRRWGLLGAMLLVLSPRIFAHGFYNSKDIPFLSLFIVGMYTLYRLLDRPTPGRGLAHALACALAIDIRIPGVILPAITAIFACADALATQERGVRRRLASAFLVFALALPPLVVLFWPTLWRDPLGNFVAAFRTMSAFPGQGSVLYRGRFIATNSLPWHYVPVWLLISTPPAWIALFAAGVAADLRGLPRGVRGVYAQRRDALIAGAWLLLPLAAVIGLRSVLYDSWRQLYFIYPAFLLFSLRGVHGALAAARELGGARGRIVRAATVAVLAGGAAATGAAMARLHPYEDLYFNGLAGRDLRSVKQRYELDYWGLSCREALEYIVAHDGRPQISVHAATIPGWTNSLILPPGDRARLLFVTDPAGARYFLGHYRWHPGDYTQGREYHSVTVDGTKIATVLLTPAGEEER